MPNWRWLYGMIWLCFAALFVAVFDPIPHKEIAHGAIGLLVLALAIRNHRALARIPCPPRLKRIGVGTIKCCGIALVTGAALAIPALKGHGIPYYAVKAIHLFAIGGIVTQTASVATAHDVWEQKECDPGPPRA